MIGRKEKGHYRITFEYAGKEHLALVDNTGNIWRSMVDHDLRNRDRLCEMIDHGSIIEVLEEEDKTPWTDMVYWDEIISEFERDWSRRFKDCRVRYRERCGDMWLEFRYDSDGQEYCQIYGMNLDNAEEAFRTLNDIDSPIGVFEDWYGMDLAPENGIPCDQSHEPMGCMRMVMDGVEIVDLKYHSTEDEAIEDAKRCYAEMSEEDRKRYDIECAYSGFNFPSDGFWEGFFNMETYIFTEEYKKDNPDFGQ